MSVDLARLAAQGRAFNGARAWEPEELDALLRLERERGVGRLLAADFIRAGIFTLEAYDEAVAAGFKPKTLNEAEVDVETILKDNEFAVELPKTEEVAPVPTEETAPAEEPVEETTVETPTEETAPAEEPVEEVAAPKKGKK